jgi:solute carrier family 25, member 38
MAGVFTAFILQPFDVLKTYTIVSSRNSSSLRSGTRLVLSKFGILGMWRGASAGVTRAMLGSGSYFLLLEEFKYLANSSNIAVLGICAGLAKASVVALCMPVSLIKIRMESPTSQIYTGMLNAVSVIYRTEGVKGYYKGLTPSIIKDVPYSVIGYGCFEGYINVLGNAIDSDRTDMRITFLAGVFAGFTATVITQPFDVIKTKVQFQSVGGGNYKNMREAIKTIYSEDGIFGFERGIVPRIAKRFISFPLVWTLYEQIKLTY